MAKPYNDVKFVKDPVVSRRSSSPMIDGGVFEQEIHHLPAMRISPLEGPSALSGAKVKDNFEMNKIRSTEVYSSDVLENN